MLKVPFSTPRKTAESCRVEVRGLAPDINDEYLKHAFGKFGKVKSIEWQNDTDSSTPPCTREQSQSQRPRQAIVTFFLSADATKAVLKKTIRIKRNTVHVHPMLETMNGHVRDIAEAVENLALVETPTHVMQWSPCRSAHHLSTRRSTFLLNTISPKDIDMNAFEIQNSPNLNERTRSVIMGKISSINTCSPRHSIYSYLSTSPMQWKPVTPPTNRKIEWFQYQDMRDCDNDTDDE